MKAEPIIATKNKVCKNEEEKHLLTEVKQNIHTSA